MHLTLANAIARARPAGRVPHLPEGRPAVPRDAAVARGRGAGAGRDAGRGVKIGDAPARRGGVVEEKAVDKKEEMKVESEVVGKEIKEGLLPEEKVEKKKPFGRDLAGNTGTKTVPRMLF